MNEPKSFINRLFATLQTMIRFFEKCFVILASSLLLTMVVIVCLNVGSRYLFNYSLAWSIEMSEYILLYVTFLAAPWLLRNDEHITVDVVYEAVAPKVKKWFRIISYTLGILVCLVLTVYGFMVTWDNYVRNVTLFNFILMPKYILLMIIPISGTFMLLEFVRRWLGEIFQGAAPTETS